MWQLLRWTWGQLWRWVPVPPVEASVRNVLVLLANGLLVLWTGVMGAVLFRQCVLPPISTLRSPLNFVFDTCPQLAGICSFPTANVSAVTLYGEHVFSAGTAYSISMDLWLEDCAENREAGVFLTVARVLDVSDVVLLVQPRSVLFRRRSGLYNVLRRLLFFPFYLIGWSNEVEMVHVDFAWRFQDNAYRPAAVISVQLQHKAIRVEEAWLTVDAQFGFLRAFLSHWPVLSTALLMSAIMGCLAGLSLVYWTHKSLVYVCHSLENVRRPRVSDPDCSSSLDEMDVPECPDLPEMEDTSRIVIPAEINGHGDSVRRRRQNEGTAV